MIAPVTNSFWSGLRSGAAGLGLSLLGSISGGCQFVVPGLEIRDGSTDDAAFADAAGNPDSAPKADGSLMADLARLPDLAAVNDSSTVNDASVVPDMAMLGAPPVTALPANAQVLPPTRAYLYWKAGTLPMGRTVAGYQLCWTFGAVTTIDDDNECPNSSAPAKSRSVVDPLSVSSTYYFKVRARYDDGSLSAWSALQAFSTDNSLAAWWRLNGNALDTKGANNAALQNGVGYGAGIDGQALQCDGVDDHANAGAGLNLAGPLAVSAWIFGNGMPMTADSGIVNKGTLNYALTYHTNGNVYFYVGMGGNNVNAPVAPNAWHHVLGVFDGTTNAGGLKLYVDGKSAASKASAVATTGAAGNLYIGRYDIHYFKGGIDNVSLYSSVLADAQVLNEFCATQAAGGIDPLPADCTP